MIDRVTAETAPSPDDRAFFGHPASLGYLSLAEGLSSFATYGMLALLVLYVRGEMVSARASGIWGFASLRNLLESAYGSMGPDATATAIAGLFGASIYATPLLGGLLADRWFGRTATVITGAVAMTCGYALMVHEAGLLPALVAIALGLGCFSANIRVQIGELYAVEDRRRARAFQIYTLISMIAVIAAPLLIGTIGEKRGYAAGFAVAAAGAAAAAISYLVAWRELPNRVRASSDAAPTAHLDPHDRRTMLILILLVPVFSLCLVGNQQILNAYLLWGQDHYDLAVGHAMMPVSWLLSLDAFIATGAALASILFWRWWASRWREPGETVKIACGALIAGLAPLSLTLGALTMGDAKLGLWWAVGFHTLNAIGYANIYPVGMALYSRASPLAIRGAMMSVFTLGVFGASLIDSKLGGFVETMASATFWSMHGVLVLVGGLTMLAAVRLSGTTLAARSSATGGMWQRLKEWGFD